MLARLVLVGVAAFIAHAGIATPAQAGGLRPVDPSAFRLQDARTWSRKSAIVDELSRSMPPVTVAQVAHDGDRSVAPLGDSPALHGVPGVVAGFRWQSGDDTTPEWYPQGITGTADASPDGTWEGARILVVSWYSMRGKGVRLTFVLADDLGHATYRHVLLVDPMRRGGVADYQPVLVHAGGIAWFGPFVYVVDTDRGVRVFDVRRMLRTTSAEDAIGRDPAGKYRAFGYKYVLPQVNAYTQLPRTGLRFSFASVDRTSLPNSLITGEYRRAAPGGRLVRWPLDAASSGLAASGGTVAATQALVSSQPSMQGALSLGGRWLLSSSTGAGAPGTLGMGDQGGPIVTSPWAVGPEDLTYSADTQRLYSLTEVPGRRVVFATPLAAPNTTPRAFRIRPSISPRRFRSRRGGQLRFALSEAARVTITVERRGRTGRRHLRYVRVGVIVRRASPDITTVTIRSRIGRRRLRPGLYRAGLHAVDPQGNVGAAARVRFRVVRGRHTAAGRRPARG